MFTEWVLDVAIDQRLAAHRRVLEASLIRALDLGAAEAAAAARIGLRLAKGGIDGARHVPFAAWIFDLARDEALAARAAKNRNHPRARKAWDRISEIHRPKIERYAIVQFYCSLEDAKDIAQDVLFKGWKAVPRREPRAPLGAWLRKIAKNDCISHYRKSKKSNAGLNMLAGRARPRTVLLGDSVDLGRVLAIFTASLAPVDANILDAVFVRGLSLHETAQRLGLTYSACHRRLYRALERLRAAMETLR